MKRRYHNAQSPAAYPIFRTVTIPTELIVGLYLALHPEAAE